MIGALLETESGAIGVLADVGLSVTLLSPHGEILDLDVVAGNAVGADDLEGSSFSAIGFGSLPVLEGEVAQLNTLAAQATHAAPVAVDVEGVRVAVTWPQ